MKHGKTFRETERDRAMADPWIRQWIDGVEEIREEMAEDVEPPRRRRLWTAITAVVSVAALAVIGALAFTVTFRAVMWAWAGC